FARAGIEIHWEGGGSDEKGIDQHGEVRVAVDPRYFRPAEVDALLADPSKAETKLDWKRTLDLKGLVELMVDADLAAVRGEPGPPEMAHLI
ncbi:MAG TPA: GDP-mannose 4,6-dehydratase, partial [Acidimicrobiia bacterium]|nr:GDP-mannose 4,6-dehydratase [Acidimicrobiia bacterium]